VVDLGMGEQHSANVAWQHRQWLPVAQAQLLEALKQAAVDEQTLPIVLDQVFGAGDGLGCIKKADVYAHAEDGAARDRSVISAQNPASA
jgi:hypothetical protein